MIDDLLQETAALIIRSHKIVVLSGAGLSTASGIPDFRSPGTGLYDNLARYQLPNAEAIFDIDYFRQRPEPFCHLARELTGGAWQPSAGHHFIRRLEQQGKLLRAFTQNIDGLDRLAGTKALVECHGTFRTASCIDCHRPRDASLVLAEIQHGRVPHCDCGGLVKPDIVFFGESLPTEFFEAAHRDIPAGDLFIVIGSSLQVHPVAGLPGLVPNGVKKILVNRESTPVVFDIELLGDINEICTRL